jgi:hypothetical protein
VGSRVTEPFEIYKHSTWDSGTMADTAIFGGPEATENKVFTVKNSLFSAVSDRQKTLAKNKPLFSAARCQPPKISVTLCTNKSVFEK